MHLGIEIGGTKLQLGVGNPSSAQLVELVRLAVEPGDRAPDLLEKIATAARPLISAHNVARVGVGFGGPVDSTTGTIVKSHHVEGWDDFDLADWFAAEFGLPAVVGNDCDVAALAEARHGAGLRRSVVLYVTVGTGVGAGLVVDGAIYAPRRFARTEIGHLRPGLDATDPSAIVEFWSSGPGIAKRLRERIAGDDVATLNFIRDAGRTDIPDAITAQHVAAAARAGNRDAVVVWNEAMRTLGWAIAQALTVTAAEVVVVGGGVALAGEELVFRPLRDYVTGYVYPPLIGEYEIVPAALEEEVVVVGAIALG